MSVADRPVPNLTTTDDEWRAFEAIREDGLSFIEASSKLGVSKQTLQNRVASYEQKQYGVRLGRKLGRRTPTRWYSTSDVRQL